MLSNPRPLYEAGGFRFGGITGLERGYNSVMRAFSCQTCNLIEQWRHLPAKLAGAYANGDDDLYESLISVGLLTLCKAAHNWQPSPLGFGRWATTKIRWAILDELRRNSRHNKRQQEIIALAYSVSRADLPDSDDEDVF